MWWKVIVFCLLVCAVLFVVLSSITGAPATMLFHRCCEDGIENDAVILETFRHNNLRERLVMEEVEYVEQFRDTEDAARNKYDDFKANSAERSDATYTSKGYIAGEDAVVTQIVSDRDCDSKNSNEAVTEESGENSHSAEATTKIYRNVKEEAEAAVLPILETKTISVHDVYERKQVLNNRESEKNPSLRSDVREEANRTLRTAIS